MTTHQEETTDVPSSAHGSPRPVGRRVRAHRKVGLVAAALLGVAVLAGACGSGSSSSSPPTTASSGGGSPSTGSATITIQNFSFSPSPITVTPGEKVTVTNKDSVAHTVTANDKKFNTGDIDGGKTVTFTAPSAPGKYPYYCMIHQYMTGMLMVKG